MTFKNANESAQNGADWAIDFNGKLILELGPGSGTFAFRLAKMNPKDYHILIDMNKNTVDRISKEIRTRSIKNATIIHGQAHETLSEIADDIYFDKVFSHFASPENVHGKTTPRLYDSETCNQIMRLTKLGSEFFATSDRIGVIKEFKTNLFPTFKEVEWRFDFIPMRPETVIGTDMEWKFCNEFEISIKKAHLVRV